MNTKHAAVAAACLSLMGCAATVTPIKGSNGTPANLVKCRGDMPELCYNKAAELCPGGYITHSRGESGGGVVPIGRSLIMTSGDLTMLVECKAPPMPAPAAK